VDIVSATSTVLIASSLISKMTSKCVAMTFSAFLTISVVTGQSTENMTDDASGGGWKVLVIKVCAMLIVCMVALVFFSEIGCFDNCLRGPEAPSTVGAPQRNPLSPPTQSPEIRKAKIKKLLKPEEFSMAIVCRVRGNHGLTVSQRFLSSRNSSEGTLSKDKVEIGGSQVCASERSTLEFECSICLDNIDEGSAVITSPNCSHIFHEECITSWLIERNCCPTCRVSMLASSDLEQATDTGTDGTNDSE